MRSPQGGHGGHKLVGTMLRHGLIAFHEAHPRYPSHVPWQPGSQAAAAPLKFSLRHRPGGLHPFFRLPPCGVVPTLTAPGTSPRSTPLWGIHMLSDWGASRGAQWAEWEAWIQDERSIRIPDPVLR